MKCYNCDYQIVNEDSKNCPICGASFAVKCHNCGSFNPKKANYCLNCGKPLNKTISNAKNVGLNENLLEAGVIFADVSGFTSLAEKLSPEETKKVINECFQRITKPVYELEGSIDKYIGDCVMVLFGVKKVHRDDAFRAVKCALEMNRIIGEYSKELYSKINIELKLSIGVNYGLVAFGKLGNLYDNENTVIGDVVNTASRLQTEALPGQIFVSKSVYDKTLDNLNYKDSVLVKAKNKANPLQCYEPLNIIVKNTENDLLIERTEEGKLLKLFFKQHRKYNGIEVIGPSGSGKTSLVNTEISLIDLSVKRILISSLETQDNQPYATITNLILQILDLNVEDENSVKSDRLISYSKYIFEEHLEKTIIRNYNFISLILGLERNNDYDSIFNSMNYKDLQEELLKQLVLFLKFAGLKTQFIISIDDALNIDEKSLNILSDIPDFSGHFVFISQRRVFKNDKNIIINLSNFNEGQTYKYISNKTNLIFKHKDMKYMHEITHGNPMYLEEICSLLNKQEFTLNKDSEVIMNDSLIKEMSRTLDHLILGRIDNLSASENQFLKISSVIGLEFDQKIIESLMSSKLDIEAIVDDLIDMNIINISAYVRSEGKLTKKLMFVHKDIFNAILNSIPISEKTKIHNDIAKAISRLYKDDINQYLGIIAFHFEYGKQLLSAKECYFDYALLKQKEFSYELSEEYFNKYLDIEKRLSTYKQSSNVIVALTELVNIMINTSRFDKAQEFITASLELEIDMNDSQQIKILQIEVFKSTGNIKGALGMIEVLEKELQSTSRLYGKMLQLKCTLYNMVGKPGVIEIASKSEDILLKAKDFLSVAEIMTQSGMSYFFKGDIPSGIDVLEKAADLAKMSGNKTVLAKIMANLGILYHEFGERNKSNSYFKKAMKLSKLVSNAAIYVNAEGNIGVSHLQGGLFIEAARLLEEGLEISCKANLIYQECIFLTNLGEVNYEQGNNDAANKYYNKSIKYSNKMKLPIEGAINSLGLAKVALRLNKNDGILLSLLDIAKVFEESEEISYLASAYYYIANYYINIKDYDSSESNIKKSISFSKKANSDVDIVKAIRKHAEILGKTGKTNDAIVLLKKAEDLAKNNTFSYELAKIYYLSSQIYKIDNNTTSYFEYLEKSNLESEKFDKCYLSILVSKEIEEIASDKSEN